MQDQAGSPCGHDGLRAWQSAIRRGRAKGIQQVDVQVQQQENRYGSDAEGVKEMKDVIIITFGMIVLCSLVIGFGLWSAKKHCESSYNNYQPEWGIWSRCRVNWNGVMTPVDIIREIK